MASTSTTKIGWIGTGTMGRWMCEHCIDMGFQMTVYNRTPEKCSPLIEKGAKWVSTPAEVSSCSDIVFTIVGHPSDVREVMSGPNGIFSSMKPRGIVVDMTTSEPRLAQELYQESSQKEIEMLDAPVSGGDIGAMHARLSIMCGGKKDVFNFVYPLFQCMGTNIEYMGSIGMGHHTKIMNQILIGANLIGIVESLIYAKKSGLELENALKVVAGGPAGSWGLNYYGPRIINRDFTPGFLVDHFIKDLSIALNECKNMNIALPGLALVHQLSSAIKTHGKGSDCANALTLILESLNNIKN